jgi:hypothetical protein
MNRWELEQKVVIKALKDPAFKKQLLANPKEAVRDFLKNEKGFDRSLWDKITVRVVEEQKEEWVLALPSISKEGLNLSDAEMEKAVGGCSVVTCFGPNC